MEINPQDSDLPKWFFNTHGRVVGAIGCRHTIVGSVWAATRGQAELRLYDKIEHLSGTQLKRAPVSLEE